MSESSSPFPFEPPPQQEQPKPGEPFWTGQDLLVLTGLALPVMIVAALLVRLFVDFVPAEQEIPALGVLAAQFAGYAFWFLALFALLRFKYGRPFWPSMGWVRPKRPLLLYAAYGPLLAMAVGIAGGLLKTPEIEMPMMELLRDRLSLIVVGAFAVTAGPLCEELAFRGFYLPRLVRSLGPAAGVLITSAVFALLHGPQYAWSWRHVLLITAAGVAFCVVRLRSKSTAAATVMHATYNLTFFIAYLTHLEDIGATW